MSTSQIFTLILRKKTIDYIEKRFVSTSCKKKETITTTTKKKHGISTSRSILWTRLERKIKLFRKQFIIR